jgi:hypothetical protein
LDAKGLEVKDPPKEKGVAGIPLLRNKVGTAKINGNSITVFHDDQVEGKNKSVANGNGNGKISNFRSI